MRPSKFVTFAGLAALGWLAAACNHSKTTPPRPPPAVTANQPARREVVEWDEYPGRLEAVDMVEVRARVGGYLQKGPFQDGTEVKKGELLLGVDPRPYQRGTETAAAALHPH